MKRFKLLASLALMVAVVFLAGQAAWSQGLKLEETKEKVVEAKEAINPHFELACTDCHLEKPTEEVGKGDRTKVVFIDNLPEDKLCFQCHDPGSNIHPVYVDPAKGVPPVVIPKIFPIGAAGDAAGKVVCTTCHFIHSKYAGYKLLRGFPEKPGDKGFAERREFCAACHGSNLVKKSPHLGTVEGEKGCSFCHATKPEKGKKAEFKLGIVDLCNFCHAATGGAHYLLVNPFADPTLKDEVPKLKLPMEGGGYTCTTCHEPHGNSKPHYVRQEYEDFAIKSRRIRPHFQQVFCRTCHKKDPVKGGDFKKDFPLLLEDPTELCNRCHASGLAVSDVHPLKDVPKGWKGGKIPADFPLRNNKLTCLTCHTPGDRAVFDPKNPSFLRGAPYESRNDPCWACHDKGAFAELDPHQDIQSGQGCAFCHQKAPDMTKKIDLQQLDFKGDINLLCLRCHDPFPHPAGIDHTGYPKEKWKPFIPKEFPLDKQGRLTCATCHNPHVGGGGTKTRGMSVGLEICPDCHKR